MFNMEPYRRNRSEKNELAGYEPFFDAFMKPFFHDWDFPREMKVDISETEKEYVLEADLPGVDKKDIDIQVKDETLFISVNHNEDKEEKKQNYIRKERIHGSLARSFYLDGIKDTDITATFDRGILKLTLPKKEESAPSHRKIEIM